MKHLELFSGIGGFRQAMDLVGRDLGCLISTIGYSEIDAKAIATYQANYDTNKELQIGDIVLFTSDEEKIKSLPDFDLLSGGFPCQTFSSMGEQAGFNEDRGQMFFRIMDIVNVKRPRYILLENVKNLVNHDRGRTMTRIIIELEGAGYIVHHDVFNTSDFGLPQTRNRTIIFARLEEAGEFSFAAELVKNVFDQMNRQESSLYFFNSTLDILAEKVSEKYYLSERIKPTILADGSAKFKANSEIDKPIARPLTASMHKMHRACQDNYYSDLFIQSKGDQRPCTWMSKEELAQIPIRKLTPYEAFLLQGFPASFVDRSRAAGVSDGALYKQAGNAVSVNVIYAVLYYLIKSNIIRPR